MLVKVPEQITNDENRPVVLVYNDDGGLTLNSEGIHIAIYFKNELEANKYKKKLILGKNANVRIYPVKVL